MWQAFTFAGDKTHQSWFEVMLKIKSWSYNSKCQHKMQFVFNIDNIALLLLHKFFNYVIFILFIQFNHLHVLFSNIYFKGSLTVRGVGMFMSLIERNYKVHFLPPGVACTTGLSHNPFTWRPL